MIRNRTAFTLTVIVAFIAVALAVFAIWQMNTGGESSFGKSFKPTPAQADEMEAEADRLIRNNYEIIKLYYIVGLPTVPEPYGNIPEDNIYIVDSEEYKTLSDVDRIVDATFITEEALKIKNNPSGSGPLFFDRGGVLGQSYHFTPNRDYQISWEPTSRELFPVSESRCDIKITLQKNGELIEFETSMAKENGKWLLTKMIYQ